MRPVLEEKNLLNPGETIKLFRLSQRKFYELINGKQKLSFLVLYNKRKLIITSGSAEKVWDGDPLTCSTYEISEGEPAGDDKITVDFTGSLTGSATDYQESDNTFTVTFNPGDEGNYDLELRYGKLTVYPPAPVTDGGF